MEGGVIVLTILSQVPLLLVIIFKDAANSNYMLVLFYNLFTCSYNTSSVLLLNIVSMHMLLIILILNYLLKWAYAYSVNLL